MMSKAQDASASAAGRFGNLGRTYYRLTTAAPSDCRALTGLAG